MILISHFLNHRWLESFSASCGDTARGEEEIAIQKADRIQREAAAAAALTCLSARLIVCARNSSN